MRRRLFHRVLLSTGNGASSGNIASPNTSRYHILAFELLLLLYAAAYGILLAYTQLIAPPIHSVKQPYNIHNPIEESVRCTSSVLFFFNSIFLSLCCYQLLVIVLLALLNERAHDPNIYDAEIVLINSINVCNTNNLDVCAIHVQCHP